MNDQNVTETFLQVAQQYQQDIAEASNYYEEQNFDARMHNNGLSVDARDLIPMVALMGIKGSTPEERTADIHAKMEELAAAFSDPDRKKRDEYLNLIYYMVDDFANNFDPVTMNMNDPAQVEQLLRGMLIEQTVGTKQKENPEYDSTQHPTPESPDLTAAHDDFPMAVDPTTNLYNGIVTKQEIQAAFSEPQAPEAVIRQAILRSRAIVMGSAAKKQLETGTVENLPALVACSIIGQLAEVSKLPEGTAPEQLAQQLEQQPSFIAALRGGNVVRRLNSGELLQQITGQKPIAEQTTREISTPKIEGLDIG
jgi:hypothetical protein